MKTLKIKKGKVFKIFLIILIIIVSIEIALLLNSKDIKNPNTSLSAPNKISYWTKRIKKIGPQEAYAEFKIMNEKYISGQQHLQAHIFGEALYSSEGILGISTCDNSFSFGCYHSFFGSAVSDKGVEIVKKLDQTCLESYGPKGLGCPHGIGHGLIEYLGHDDKNLIKGLAQCEKLSWKGKIFGCSSGAFMEYFFPALTSPILSQEGKVELSSLTTSIHQLDPLNSHAPCNQIPEQHKASCYYEIVPWWNIVYKGDMAKLESLCSEIEENEYRKYCFISIGATFAYSGEKGLEKTISNCQSMKTIEREDLCRAGASWRYFSLSEHDNTSIPDPCADLSTSRKEACFANSNIMGLKE